MKFFNMELPVESLSWESMSERDRKMLMYGAIAVAVLFLFGVLIPLDSSVSKANGRVTKKQEDLTWMKGVAPAITAAGPPPSPSGEPLLVIVDRSAREAGLASSLAGSEPQGSGVLSVRLDKAPFDAIVGWLARIEQSNGIHVESATIDNSDAPGLVNAAIVLRVES